MVLVRIGENFGGDTETHSPNRVGRSWKSRTLVGMMNRGPTRIVEDAAT